MENMKIEELAQSKLWKLIKSLREQEHIDFVIGDHLVSSIKGSSYAHHGIYAGDNRVIHFQNPQNLNRYPQPGDHILSKRYIISKRDCMYDHHGIYQDEDNCIHYGKSRSNVSPVRTKGYVHPPTCNCTQPTEGQGGVITSCFACFHKGNEIRIIRYIKEITSKIKDDWKRGKSNINHGKVIKGYRNNKFYLELFKDDGELLGHVQISKKGSRKYTIDPYVRMSRFSSSMSPDEVIETATALKDFGKYSLIFHNCEHFAVFCKTGKARSLQVEQKVEAIPWLWKKVYKNTLNANRMSQAFLTPLPRLIEDQFS